MRDEPVSFLKAKPSTAIFFPVMVLKSVLTTRSEKRRF